MRTQAKPQGLLRFADIALRILVVLNLVCAVLFAGLLAFSFVVEPKFVAGLAQKFGAAAPDLLMLLRMVVVLGIACVWPVHIIFTRLRAIIGSIVPGQAFSLANAARLKLIGWALLGTQIIDLGFGAIATRARSLHPEVVLDWQPSLTAWLAVLLLFILARVFEEGATMRDELEGTV